MGSIKLDVFKIINQLQLIVFAAEADKHDMILSAVGFIEGILNHIKATVS